MQRLKRWNMNSEWIFMDPADACQSHLSGLKRTQTAPRTCFLLKQHILSGLKFWFWSRRTSGNPTGAFSGTLSEANRKCPTCCWRFSVWRHATLLYINACGDSFLSDVRMHTLPRPTSSTSSTSWSLCSHLKCSGWLSMIGALMCWMSDPEPLRPTCTPCMTSVLKRLQWWREL